MVVVSSFDELEHRYPSCPYEFDYLPPSRCGREYGDLVFGILSLSSFEFKVFTTRVKLNSSRVDHRVDF